ncbi:TonB-dependent receptor plug domain-containing protein [Flectobacillus major]|uniref:TonB-dependent receptor plug domain-containing protein n=1 Tax=Flectobacillus major TaxID=103 RepID=UPI000414845B|nr:TonB-dependent receptor plug domain-containing protein [Flectobacillus major]
MMFAKHKTLYLVLLCIVGLSAFRFSDENPILEKILTQLEKFRNTVPQEKVYLHFDKPYYMAGETVWFKAYLFDASNHRIDSVSRVLYVDLVNESTGKVILQRILKSEGVAHGDMALPDTLTEGMYQLRAYTNYMRNFSDELFFHKNIKIWQGTIQSTMSEAKALDLSNVASVQFFPEGGDLVQNLPSRVGFKAVNKLGKGVDIEGIVLDETQDTVAVFKSAHLGIGMFNFVPMPDKNYKAYVKKTDGKYWEQPFPQAKPSGFAMLVDNITYKDKIRVFVKNSHPKPAGQGKEMTIIVQQRGQLCLVGKGSESSGTFMATVPKNIIPDDGIVQITLFTPDGLPVCERLIFAKHDKEINLAITSNKEVYQSREKVTLTLTAKDANGKPLKGNFSVAVTDAGQVKEEPYQETLLSYLLLSSDIKDIVSNEYYSAIQGTIEEPSYYFDKNIMDADLHLDMLLMTQGWRRFTWKQMLDNAAPPLKYFIEQGLSIKGKALKPNGKVAEQVNLTVMLKKGKGFPVFLLTSTDSLGRFAIDDLDFTDTTEVLVQATKGNGGRNLSVTLDKADTQPKVKLVKLPYNPIEFDANEYATFLKHSKEALEIERKSILNKVQVLQEVTVTAKKEERDTRKIYGKANNTLKIDETMCGGVINVLQFLQGRVAGVQVTPSGMNSFKVVIRGVSSITGSSDPLFLLDGMPVDADVINSVSPCDVESIDVLKGAETAIFGVRGGNGAISVLTKRGDSFYDWSKEQAAGIVTQKRMGYYPSREFYAPQYDVQKPEHIRPDYRSTLHWAPHVQTDSTGVATISFWNTDAKSEIRIKAEGITLQGRIGVAQHKYLVK